MTYPFNKTCAVCGKELKPGYDTECAVCHKDFCASHNLTINKYDSYDHGRIKLSLICYECARKKKIIKEKK